MSRTRFHVVRRGTQWQVQREGGLFSMSYDTLDEAVEAAKVRARISEPARVLVHDENGRQVQDFTFGENPPTDHAGLDDRSLDGRSLDDRALDDRAG